MGSFLSSILFLVCRIRQKSRDFLSWLPTLKNFSTTATGQGEELLHAIRTQDPSRNWSFFLCTRKIARWESANWRLPTVNLLKSSQRRKPKNRNANRAATWISPSWPCSSQQMTLMTSLTSKALLLCGGFTRIRRPTSATWWTMRWSLYSWQPLLLPATIRQ